MYENNQIRALLLAYCLHERKIKRVSEVESSWADAIKQESKPKEYFLKFDK